MAIINLEDLKIGDRIKFKSISDHDNVVWEGKIVGFFSYTEMFQDLRPYYAEVKKKKPDLKDLELLNFFMLQVKKDAKTTRNVLFAKEYVDISTLEKIDLEQIFNIKIALSNKNELPTILNLLKTHGYVAWEE